MEKYFLNNKKWKPIKFGSIIYCWINSPFVCYLLNSKQVLIVFSKESKSIEKTINSVKELKSILKEWKKDIVN